MTWRVAKSLDVLLAQINEAHPDRSKVSDGSIGDAKHSARLSDHNPNAEGVVCARDFTHDPEHGFDAGVLADALAAGKDARLKYVIWNRRIWNPTYGYWRPYSGTNPHQHHVHVSVHGLYDSERLWQIVPQAPAPAASVVTTCEVDIARLPVLEKGASGEDVQTLQALLIARSHDEVAVDGEFGPGTLAAVKAVQKWAKLKEDGIVGPATWTALLRMRP